MKVTTKMAPQVNELSPPEAMVPMVSIEITAATMK